MMKGGWRSTIRNKNEELMVLAGKEVVEEFAEGLGSCDQVRESPKCGGEKVHGVREVDGIYGG